ncbi:MAG: hypothetical protein Q8P13_02565 [bacterium]|nr:hypothetical protein [bacterium]
MVFSKSSLLTFSWLALAVDWNEEEKKAQSQNYPSDGGEAESKTAFLPRADTKVDDDASDYRSYQTGETEEIPPVQVTLSGSTKIAIHALAPLLKVKSLSDMKIIL